MSNEFEKRFVKPIVNSAAPATLAGLDLAVLQFSANPGQILSLTFLVGAAGFMLSAFSIFSYTLYPTRGKIWTATALTFLVGLVSSVLAVLVLLVRVYVPSFLL